MSVESLDQQWINLHDQISDEITPSAREQLAGLFLGYAKAEFMKLHPRILYVGKATDRSFTRDEFNQDKETQTIETRIIRQRSRMKDYFFVKNSSFWAFAERLSGTLNGVDCANVAWSNLCRIGVLKGNPSPYLVNRQKDLAVQTLRMEIQEYSPAIVVFVTSRYAREIVFEVAGDSPLWAKSEDDPASTVGDVWWRESEGTAPSFLWMRHPQFAPSSTTEYALARAAWLLRGKEGHM